MNDELFYEQTCTEDFTEEEQQEVLTYKEAIIGYILMLLACAGSFILKFIVE